MSVQAAYERPLVSNTVGVRTVSCCVVMNGAKNQVSSWLIANARIVSREPRRASLAAVQRTRPMPWVQAKRYVLVSSSLATTGGPANIATSTGAACTAMCRYCP